MNRKLKEFLKDSILFTHKALLKCRVSVIPNHYYSPVPDINYLAKTKDRWAQRSSLCGLRFDADKQARNMANICSRFEPEFRGNKIYRSAQGWGPGFGYIEAQALHGFIRHFKPKRIIEVGAGVTTHCMLSALDMNGGPCEYISIEPHPSEKLLCAPVRLVDKPVQTVDRAIFDSLESGDFLFIDSSHAVKTGSDVNFLILEVLPSLKPGVLVHFHDFFLPYDYRPDILYTFFDWQETALLHAFLIDNQRIETLFCMAYLHFEKPEALRAIFPEYSPLQLAGGLVSNHKNSKLHMLDEVEHFPASLFLRTL